MSLLYKRKILLGISGSIAAYKCGHLVRELIKRGAEVQVVITHTAKDFVTPLTLSTLSKRPVYSEFIEDEQKPYGVWNNHVDMGLWADLMIVAPASSNTLSNMATGACNNLLTAVYLSAKCPVFVAPAMDLDMHSNGATQNNLEVLKQRNVEIIHAEFGELASGLVGKGRMAEPENIANFVERELKKRLPLSGKQVLINAGPTHEHLDPVRFLGNNSSGKMGAALAAAARDLGADVRVVLGPTQANLDLHGMDVINVTSALEMLEHMQEHFLRSCITICTAAVSDYMPVNKTNHKIKKTSAGDELSIPLKKTPDILSLLGKSKTSNNVLIGFALETNNGSAYAKDKLREKNADAIILNTLGKKGVGFETETNEVNVFTASGKTVSYPLQDKKTLGKTLFSLFIEEFNLTDE